jgi:hypothetical protein
LAQPIQSLPPPPSESQLHFWPSDCSDGNNKSKARQLTNFPILQGKGKEKEEQKEKDYQTLLSSFGYELLSICKDYGLNPTRHHIFVSTSSSTTVHNCKPQFCDSEKGPGATQTTLRERLRTATGHLLFKHRIWKKPWGKSQILHARLSQKST